MNIFRRAFIIPLLFPASAVFSQKSDVYDELKSAFSYGTDAKEKGDEVISAIRKAMSSSTVDDMQYYARKAKNLAEEGKSEAENAEDDASDAEDEARSISCSGAEDEADDAESAFSSAGVHFDEAYTHLRRAENEDDKDDLEMMLRRARTEIEEAISEADDGMEQVNDAIDELNNCE